MLVFFKTSDDRKRLSILHLWSIVRFDTIIKLNNKVTKITIYLACLTLNYFELLQLDLTISF